MLTSTSQRLKALSEPERKKLLSALHARELAKCKEDFSYFLFRYVKTKDEHDPLNPIKPFPDKEYLRFLADELQHGPRIAYIAKSRQLMVSWILCAYAVWKMLYYPHSAVYFQSKKEGDAADMIYNTVPQFARMSLIMATLPEWMQVCLVHTDSGERSERYSLDQRTFTYGSVMLPNGSHCKALAQGAAQVEGKVPSLYIGDEASLQDEWRSAQAAVVPCLSNGGQGITVGTMRLPSDYGHEISTAADVDPDSTFRGVARFTSRSGIPSLRIHYSADPDKDPATEVGRAFFTEETNRMPGGYDGVEWQQHYEINPLSVTGTRCIPYWNDIKDRVVIDDIPYETAALWKLGAGADYGTRNPTVLLYCAIDYHGNLYALDEQAAPGLTVHTLPGIDKGGIAGLSQLFKQHPLFHRVNGQAQMDSTIWRQDQNQDTGGLTSVAQMFTMQGVFFQPAKSRGTDADDLTLNRLHEWWAGYDDPDWSPQFFICRRCTGLISILAKAEYADWSANAQQSNDLKAKMRPTVGMDFFDALKHWVVSLPQGPSRIKAAPPLGSFDYLRNLVRKEVNRTANHRS